VKPQHDHKSDLHLNSLASIWQRVHHVQHIMDGQPFMFPRYLFGLKFSDYQDHAVQGISIFGNSDHNWPSWMIFIFTAEMSWLKSSNPVFKPVFNCQVGRTFFT
jgi:hypothetical protein